MSDRPIHYRPIEPTDSRDLFNVFYDALADVDRRLGDPDAWDPEDAAMRSDAWEGWRGLFEHVAATSDLGYLAEDDGGVIGYARSIRRGDERELTEFFVSPQHQGLGIGRELLGRSFPSELGVRRSIIATLEPGALRRYLGAGLGVHTMVGRFGRTPERDGSNVIGEAGLGAAPMTGARQERDDIGRLDETTLGYRRDVDHAWFQSLRDGIVYRRGTTVVGYAYLGRGSGSVQARCGPVLASDPTELPAILVDVEDRAARAGLAEVSFWVPLLNVVATGHLLGRAYRLDRFLAALFADTTHPGLDRYVITSPPFFL